MSQPSDVVRRGGALRPRPDFVPDRDLDAAGELVLARAVRTWRSIDDVATDHRRGTMAGLLLALADLWGVSNDAARARVRELASER